MTSRILFALILALACRAQGQLLVSDNFNVSGGDSVTNGFGLDGINTQINDINRISGVAVTNHSLIYANISNDKAAEAFSISNNTLLVASTNGIGQVELSTDGTNAFDFGSYLVGKTYEISITMDNDSVDTVNRRMSLTLASTPNQTVNVAPLSLQLQADANSASEQIFKRVGADCTTNGVAINQSIASGLTYGDPVTLKIKVVDVKTSYYILSTYEIYLNGSSSPIDTGTFNIPNASRYLIFDIAPNSGPCTYDDFSLNVISNAPAAPTPVVTATRSPIYFVGNDGAIYEFTGFTTDTGNMPITNAASFTEGIPVATNASYGTYQAFTIDPVSGTMYGIDSSGNMITWPTLNDWINDANSSTAVYGAYGADGGQGSVHGASYDPATGGYYVVFGGDATINGDIGEFATLNDFLNGINWIQSGAGYNGNILNFYYWGEDAPGNQSSQNTGANYFQGAGNGRLEGWQTLPAYIANANNLTFARGGFCNNCIAAFSVPLPPEIMVKLGSVQKDASGAVTGVTLNWETSSGTSYSVLGSTNLENGFTLVPGYDNVTTTPVSVTLPAGYENGGYFRVKSN